MRREEYVEHLRADSATTADAVRADPDAPVPTCPGWDRRALLRHLGGVHAWVRAQLAAGPGERRTHEDAERPPAGDELFDWFATGATALAAGLEAMDLDASWPTSWGARPGLWFPRRMAQETAVHRWDVAPAPLDGDLAADGLDELLRSFLRRVPAERLEGVAGTIHLHATDAQLQAPCEWLLSLGPDGIQADPVHAKGDVALRGPASDLLLWAWNRAPLDRLEVLGDAALAARWSSIVTL
jgi:uncharacterized protein (TIGR03083 family)